MTPEQHSNVDKQGQEEAVVYMKNKTFPLMTSVTSRLYPGIIFNILDKAVLALTGTLEK